MNWKELLDHPWRKVTLDVTSLPTEERDGDPTSTQPPILDVKVLDAEPDPGTHGAPPGYIFLWHDLHRDLRILFVGVQKRPT